MDSNRPLCRLYILLILAALFLVNTSTHAQTMSGDELPARTSEKKEGKRADSRESAESKDDVEQLNDRGGDAGSEELAPFFHPGSQILARLWALAIVQLDVRQDHPGQTLGPFLGFD